jgi:hypothetical protein
VRVWLPSSLDSEQMHTCLQGVHKIECRLRVAQAAESIHKLCNARRLRAHLWSTFKTHVAGDGGKPSTRARSVVNSVEAQCRRHVDSYRAAWNALEKLDPKGSWRNIWPKLEDADVRGPTLAADELDVERRSRRSAKSSRSQLPNLQPLLAKSGSSNGMYVQSWIWHRRSPTMDGGGTTEVEYNNQARAEWARAQARAEQWTEEEHLLEEEMRRTLVTYRYCLEQWLKKVGACVGVGVADISRYDVAVFNGLDTYAYEQADMYRSLARQLLEEFEPLLVAQTRGNEWLPAVRAWVDNSSPENKNALTPSPWGGVLSDDDSDCDENDIDTWREDGTSGPVEDLEGCNGDSESDDDLAADD